MPKKDKVKDIEIIILYAEKDGNEEKSLQNVIQKLFNLHITKVIQNINKDK